MHTVPVYVQDEDDVREDRETLFKLTTGQGLECVFTPRRHGTLKGKCDGKNVHEKVIHNVHKFETLPAVFTLWAMLPEIKSACRLRLRGTLIFG